MQLPKILEKKADSTSARLELEVSSNMKIFEGHFDDFPIVPGVVQLGWVIQLAEKIFGQTIEQQITSVDKLKFQQVIVPGSLLLMKLKMEDSRLVFELLNDKHRFSSGSLKLLKRDAKE